MRDRIESTPLRTLPADRRPAAADAPEQHPSPPEQLAWRETFLWRFHRPEVAAAFRFLGDALLDLMNEAGAWGPDPDLPVTWAEVRAASDDLDDLARFLEQVAGDRHHSTLDEVSDALAIEANGWAERLGGLVRDMRRSLGRNWDQGDEADPDPADDHDAR